MSISVEYQWQLPVDVHAAIIGGSLILLNASSNEYAFVEKEEAQPLIAFLCSGGRSPLHGQAVAPSLLDQMFEQGLLTIDAACGKPFELTSMLTDAREVPGVHINRLPATRMVHLTAMLRAVLKARAYLRWRSLPYIFEEIRRLRKTKPITLEVSEDEVAELMEHSMRLRPVFFNGQDNCMVNSLSTIFFLQGFGCFPSWTFGVSLNPFAAHCWVEDERFIYNDQLSNIYGFTPILRI